VKSPSQGRPHPPSGRAHPAFASGASRRAAPTAATVVPGATVDTPDPPNDAGKDGDNVQRGDQNAPDTGTAGFQG